MYELFQPALRSLALRNAPVAVLSNLTFLCPAADSATPGYGSGRDRWDGNASRQEHHRPPPLRRLALSLGSRAAPGGDGFHPARALEFGDVERRLPPARALEMAMLRHS